MKYSYYPGCSLERNAIAYHQSTLAVADPLGLEFTEDGVRRLVDRAPDIVGKQVPRFAAGSLEHKDVVRSPVNGLDDAKARATFAGLGVDL